MVFDLKLEERGKALLERAEKIRKHTYEGLENLCNSDKTAQQVLKGTLEDIGKLEIKSQTDLYGLIQLYETASHAYSHWGDLDVALMIKERETTYEPSLKNIGKKRLYPNTVKEIYEKVEGKKLEDITKSYAANLRKELGLGKVSDKYLAVFANDVKTVVLERMKAQGILDSKLFEKLIKNKNISSKENYAIIIRNISSEINIKALSEDALRDLILKEAKNIYKSQSRAWFCKNHLPGLLKYFNDYEPEEITSVPSQSLMEVQKELNELYSNAAKELITEFDEVKKGLIDRGFGYHADLISFAYKHLSKSKAPINTLAKNMSEYAKALNLEALLKKPVPKKSDVFDASRKSRVEEREITWHNASLLSYDRPVMTMIPAEVDTDRIELAEKALNRKFNGGLSKKEAIELRTSDYFRSVFGIELDKRDIGVMYRRVKNLPQDIGTISGLMKVNLDLQQLFENLGKTADKSLTLDTIVDKTILRSNTPHGEEESKAILCMAAIYLRSLGFKVNKKQNKIEFYRSDEK